MKTTARWCVMLAMISAAGLIMSCKDDGETADTEKPTITIDEPAANDTLTVSAGETEVEIHIEFVARDNDKLQQVSVLLASPTNASLYANTPDVANQQSYSFHQHVHATPTDVTQLTLTITATDAHGNKETRTVVFYMAP